MIRGIDAAGVTAWSQWSRSGSRRSWPGPAPSLLSRSGSPTRTTTCCRRATLLAARWTTRRRVAASAHCRSSRTTRSPPDAPPPSGCPQATRTARTGPAVPGRRGGPGPGRPQARPAGDGRGRGVPAAPASRADTPRPPRHDHGPGHPRLRACLSASPARQVLPAPGSPATRRTWRRPCTAASRASATACRSRRRPTSGRPVAVGGSSWLIPEVSPWPATPPVPDRAVWTRMRVPVVARTPRGLASPRTPGQPLGRFGYVRSVV